MTDSATMPLDPLAMPPQAAGGAPARAPALARSSAATLASEVNDLLATMSTRDMPRVASICSQLSTIHPTPELTELQHAMEAVLQGAGALDVMASRSDGDGAATFTRQASALAKASHVLSLVGGTFLMRQHGVYATQVHASSSLRIEAARLRAQARQGWRALADMDRDLAGKRAVAGSEVSRRALEELARRGAVLRERLQQVDRMCADAEAVVKVADELRALCAGFCDTLQRRVRPPSSQLHRTLRVLLEATEQRPPQPVDLMATVDARHALQVVLTAADAELARLQAFESELVALLARLGQAVQA